MSPGVAMRCLSPLLLFVLTACPPGTSGATLELDQPVADLGVLPPDSSSRVDVPVNNTGTRAAEWQVTTDNPSFSVPSSLRIEAGGRVPLEVVYTAEGHDQQGIIAFRDADGSVAAELRVRGSWDRPELAFDGTALDTVGGCTSPLSITNDSVFAVAIDRIASDVSGLSIDLEETVLEPGDTWRGELDLDLDLAGPVSGALTVGTVSEPTQGRHDTTTALTGEIDASGDHAQTYAVPGRVDGRLDIVMALDQSGSMEAVHFDLAESLWRRLWPVFGDDWQLALVPFFHGCHAGGYADETTGLADLRQAMVKDGEAATSDTERGLEMARDAVLDETGCNEGMIRDDAGLAVVVVSNERDQSAPYDYPGDPLTFSHWRVYVEELRAVAPSSRIHGLIGADEHPLWNFDQQGGTCAERGEAYWQAIRSTGGLRGDVCAESYDAFVDSLAAVLTDDADARRIALPLGTLQVDAVSVDGTAATGWTVDLDTQAVWLDAPLLPGSTATLEVIAPDCPE